MRRILQVFFEAVLDLFFMDIWKITSKVMNFDSEVKPANNES